MLASVSLLSAITASGAALIWQQSEPDYVYSSAAISRHGPGVSPTFAATASFLLKPTFLEAYNISSQDGVASWQYIDDRPGGNLIVATARHTEAQGAGAVDIAAALLPPSAAVSRDCVVLGFASIAASSTPSWVWNASACAIASISFTDDGSAVFVSGGLDVGQPKLAPAVWRLDGQTGAVVWKQGGVDASQYGGSVMASEHGAFVAYSRDDDTVVIFDGTTGEARGEAVDMGWNTEAQLSDTGDFLAFSGQDNANIYQYTASSAKYELAFQITPSGPSKAWYSVSTAVSSDGTGAEMGELACFGFICGAGANSNCSGTALQARVIIASMVTGAVLTDYFTAVNDALQTNPVLKMDGDYCGLALWGDRDDVPTGVVLQAGNSTPVFT